MIALRGRLRSGDLFQQGLIARAGSACPEPWGRTPAFNGPAGRLMATCDTLETHPVGFEVQVIFVATETADEA